MGTWRLIVGPCPKCGREIGVSDYGGCWGLAYCEGCKSVFNAYQMGEHYPEKIVSGEEAKKFACQSIRHVRVSEWPEKSTALRRNKRG